LHVDEADGFRDRLTQRDALLLQLETAGFDARDVEHVVDER